MYKRDASQVVTFEPNGTDGRYLGETGGISGLQYSYRLPGGCDQLQCLLQREPGPRVRAIEPGRIVKVYRGVSEVWDGEMDMPTPSNQGWQVNCHGAGNFGSQYAAYYTGTWGTGTPDNVLNNAIGRGLRWVNPGISGMGVTPYMGQPIDPSSQQIDAFLGSITGPANLTWFVGRNNVFSMFAPPVAPVNCLVITSVAVARALAGYFTQIWLRYQSSADSKTSGNAAVFGTTSYQNAPQALAHGQQETYQDLSQAGTLTAAAAQAVGQNQIARYQAASFAGPFNLAPGQLCNPGGSPIDLGLGMAGPMVAQVLVANNSYGGEVIPTPPLTMLLGGYTFYDDTGGAQITPFQYAANDLSTLLSNWVTLHTKLTTATAGTRTTAGRP